MAVQETAKWLSYMYVCITLFNWLLITHHCSNCFQAMSRWSELSMLMLRKMWVNECTITAPVCHLTWCIVYYTVRCDMHTYTHTYVYSKMWIWVDGFYYSHCAVSTVYKYNRQKFYQWTVCWSVLKVLYVWLLVHTVQLSIALYTCLRNLVTISFIPLIYYAR